MEESYDPDAFGEALRSNSAAWEALNAMGVQKQEEAKAAGRNEGGWQVLNHLAATTLQVVGKADLAAKYQGRLNSGMLQNFDLDLAKDLMEEGAAPHKAKVAKLEAQIEKMKAGSRQGQGPDENKPYSAGGRSDDELLMDPLTPIETLIAIRDRQKAGG